MRSVALALVLLAASARDARADHIHGLYAEVMGKAGLWGIGVDRRLHPRITIGAVGSFYSLDGQRVLAVSPYVGVYVVRSRPHAWFVDAGPLAVHTWSPSPIPEWDGHSDSGIGIGVSTGYEYRARMIVRIYGHGVAGPGGVLPWLGAGVGCAF